MGNFDLLDSRPQMAVALLGFKLVIPDDKANTFWLRTHEPSHLKEVSSISTYSTFENAWSCK